MAHRKARRCCRARLLHHGRQLVRRGGVSQATAKQSRESAHDKRSHLGCPILAVAVQPVASGSCVELDASKLHAVWRRSESDKRRTTQSTCVPADGWLRPLDSNTRLVDPSFLMSSRDLDPVVWPKVWHFLRKLDALGGSLAENGACFGEVPVKWVPGANRWMAGNRHRPMLAHLSGQPCPAVPRRGEVCVDMM